MLGIYITGSIITLFLIFFSMYIISSNCEDVYFMKSDIWYSILGTIFWPIFWIWLIISNIMRFLK